MPSILTRGSIARRRVLQFLLFIGIGVFLSVQSYGQCTITIAPKSVTTCSGVNFAVSPSTGGGDVVPAGTVYTWSIPSYSSSSITGGGSGTNATSFSGTLTNLTAVPIAVAYTVTPFSTCNGTAAPFTVTVTVNPKASVNAINLTTCSGVSFTITPTAGTIPTGVS